MSFDVTATPYFLRDLKPLSKKYRSLKKDIAVFLRSLENNPFQGDELSPGIRKIRLAVTSKGKGKSGGARVITYTVVFAENQGHVYVMNIYDKSEFSTVDVAVIRAIIAKLGL